MNNPRSDIVDILKKLVKNELTTISGGNLSVKCDSTIYLTPKGIDKGSLQEQDIVQSNNGVDWEGKYPPSTEYLFHTVIYKTDPTISAIIHSHSPSLTSFCCQYSTPIFTCFPPLKHYKNQIKLIDFYPPGTQELCDAVEMETKNKFRILLLKNHGIIISGDNLTSIYNEIYLLETYCYIYLLCNNRIDSSIEFNNTELLDDNTHYILDYKYTDDEVSEINYYINIIKRCYDKKYLWMFYLCQIYHKLSNNKIILYNHDNINMENIQIYDILVVKQEADDFCVYSHKNQYLLSPCDKLMINYLFRSSCKSISITLPIYTTLLLIGRNNFTNLLTQEGYLVMKKYSISDINLLNNSSLFAGEIDCNDCLFIQNYMLISKGTSLIHMMDRTEVVESISKSIYLLGGDVSHSIMNTSETDYLNRTFKNQNLIVKETK